MKRVGLDDRVKQNQSSVSADRSQQRKETFVPRQNG